MQEEIARLKGDARVRAEAAAPLEARADPDPVLDKHLQDLQAEIDGIKDRLDEGCGQSTTSSSARRDKAVGETLSTIFDRLGAMTARLNRLDADVMPIRRIGPGTGPEARATGQGHGGSAPPGDQGRGGWRGVDEAVKNPHVVTQILLLVLIGAVCWMGYQVGRLAAPAARDPRAPVRPPAPAADAATLGKAYVPTLGATYGEAWQAAGEGRRRGQVGRRRPEGAPGHLAGVPRAGLRRPGGPGLRPRPARGGRARHAREAGRGGADVPRLRRRPEGGPMMSSHPGRGDLHLRLLRRLLGLAGVRVDGEVRRSDRVARFTGPTTTRSWSDRTWSGPPPAGDPASCSGTAAGSSVEVEAVLSTMPTHRCRPLRRGRPRDRGPRRERTRRPSFTARGRTSLGLFPVSSPTNRLLRPRASPRASTSWSASRSRWARRPRSSRRPATRRSTAWPGSTSAASGAATRTAPWAPGRRRPSP
jgi:hypothetical protein